MSLTIRFFRIGLSEFAQALIGSFLSSIFLTVITSYVQYLTYRTRNFAPLNIMLLLEALVFVFGVWGFVQRSVKGERDGLAGFALGLIAGTPFLFIGLAIANELAH